MRQAAPHLVLASLLLALTLAGLPASACPVWRSPSEIPVEVRDTQIDVTLHEGYARVVVIKEFYNPSSILKEGEIAIPLVPGRELITGLRLRAGNVEFNATAQESAEAFEEYLATLERGGDAALVQYDRARQLYSVRVTIPPEESRTVIVTLEMSLPRTDGFYEYTYRVSMDEGPGLSPHRVHIRVEADAPLSAVELPSHPSVPLKRPAETVAEAFLNGSARTLGGFLRVRFRTESPSITQAVDENGLRYVRYSLAESDPAFDGARRPLARAFLFLLDGSGSMAGSGRWDLARAAMRELGRGLGLEDRFGLAVFQGKTPIPFTENLGAWDDGTELRLAGFLFSVHPRGSTNLSLGLPLVERWAQEGRRGGRQPVLVLLTDGRPTTAVAALELESAYRRLASHEEMPVFAAAVGVAPGSPQAALLEMLSRPQGGDLLLLSASGLPAAVAWLLDAPRVPVLPAVTTTFPGAEGLVWASRNPQNVMEGGQALALVRMNATPEPLRLRVTWDDALGNRTVLERVYAVDTIPVRPLVARQWLLARLHTLLRALESREDPETLADLRETAVAYGVATPYTSLLVTLPDEREDPRGQAASMAPGPFVLPLLDGPDREARAWKEARSHPLVVEGEVDRYVSETSPEASLLLARAQAEAYRGRYLTIVEVDGELIGITRGWMDRPTYLVNLVWLALAAGAVLGILRLGRLPGRKGQEARPHWPAR